MSNLILLIQSEADIAALPVAAESIIAHGYKGCWILVSPAIAVNAAEASAKYDKEIADLRMAELAAAGRGDYAAAAEHKLAREGKELERGTAVASAWKSVVEADRMAAIRAKLAPLMTAFTGKMNVKTQITQDHYDAAQWIAMLNSLSGAWFKEFAHGAFSVAWPGAIPAMGVKIPIVQELAAKLPVPQEAPVDVAKAVNPGAFPKGAGNAVKKPTKTPLVAATNPDERRKQLTNMPFFTRKSVANKLGINAKGKSTEQIVDAILAAEFATATA